MALHANASTAGVDMHLQLVARGRSGSHFALGAAQRSRCSTLNEGLAPTTAAAVTGAASNAATPLQQPFRRRSRRRQADDLRAEHAPNAQQAVSDGYKGRRECGFGRLRAHKKVDSGGLWQRNLGPCAKRPACLQFTCMSSNVSLREGRAGQTGVITKGLCGC